MSRTKIGKRKSPDGGGTRARDRARHVHDVLAAAEPLFAAHGFEATPIAAIAAEAGFAVATLYNLFSSKEAILEELLARHMETLLAETRQVVARTLSPRARLEQVFVTRARYLVAHRDFFRLYVTEVPGSAAAPGARSAGSVARPRVIRAVQEELDLVEAAFREVCAGSGAGSLACGPAERALAFQGAMKAYAVERILRARRAPSVPALLRYVALVLDGLASSA